MSRKQNLLFLKAVFKKNLKIKLFTFMLVVSHASTVFADPMYEELFRKVEKLERAGHYDLAEPILFKLSQDTNSFIHLQKFLNKYKSSKYYDLVYKDAYNIAKNSTNKALLTSFVLTTQSNRKSFTILKRLFSLYEKQNEIVGYKNFLKDFPNSPQSIKAIEAIHRLAFENAKAINTESSYDQFIRSFRQSKFGKQALETSVNIAIERIKEDVTSYVYLVDADKKESAARDTYNRMRKAEKSGEYWLSEKLYYVLNDSFFNDTKVLSEALDREELQQFRKEHLSQQYRIRRLSK